MKITIGEEMQFLRAVFLFQTLERAELKVIALTTEKLLFDPGEVIVGEGDEGYEAYVIYSGRVEVYRRAPEGGIICVNVMGPGEMFGELALFGDGYRTASVKALQETLVAVVSKEKLYEIIREFPSVAIKMLKVLTQRHIGVENRLMALINKQ